MITVLPTIDVEGVHGRRPFEQMVLGEIGGREDWGVYRIARVLNEFGLRGTFFVDIYEYTLWGKGPIARMCTQLCELGQDVQLHTHPAWRDDSTDFAELRQLKREKSYRPQAQDLMAKLALEEQVEVLEQGCELIAQWTGRRPVVHRGGGYSINQDTITALRRVGIPADSSMNRAHSNSVVTWSCNQIVQRDGLLELPVTVMKYCFGVPWTGSRMTLYSKLMKTDLDSCTLDELQQYVVQADLLGLKCMNLFMHSYSLLSFDRFYRRFAPDAEDETKLRDFLRWACDNPHARVSDCATYQAELCADPLQKGERDAVPAVTANRRIMGLGTRKIRNVLLEKMSR